MASDRRGFARELEAFTSLLVLQAQTGDVYVYPHEVRENLRMIGCRVDKKLPQFADHTFDWERHEPDFGPEMEEDEGLTDEEDES